MRGGARRIRGPHGEPQQREQEVAEVGPPHARVHLRAWPPVTAPLPPLPTDRRPSAEGKAVPGQKLSIWHDRPPMLRKLSGLVGGIMKACCSSDVMVPRLLVALSHVCYASLEGI